MHVTESHGDYENDMKNERNFQKRSCINAQGFYGIICGNLCEVILHRIFVEGFDMMLEVFDQKYSLLS
jgi:hypothetical protein